MVGWWWRSSNSHSQTNVSLQSKDNWFLMTQFLIVCLLLVYVIAMVFQWYHGSDMMYEMRRRKPDFAILPTQGIFNLPHQIGVLWYDIYEMRRRKPKLAILPTQGIFNLPHHIRATDLWWRCKLCTAGESIAALNVIAVTGIRSPVLRVI